MRTKGGTPMRYIRIPDPLWRDVQAVADAEGCNASALIRRLLGEYVDENSRRP